MKIFPMMGFAHRKPWQWAVVPVECAFMAAGLFVLVLGGTFAFIGGTAMWLGTVVRGNIVDEHGRKAMRVWDAVPPREMLKRMDRM